MLIKRLVIKNSDWLYIIVNYLRIFIMIKKFVFLMIDEIDFWFLIN